MFRHGEFSTEVDKKPFLFTLIVAVGGLVTTILILTLGSGQGLGIFAGIMMGLVTIAALSVLFAMVTDRAYIEEGSLTMTYLFKKKVVPIRDIGSISYKEDIYTVTDRKGNRLGEINAKLTGIDSVILKLDQSGVKFI